MGIRIERKPQKLGVILLASILAMGAVLVPLNRLPLEVIPLLLFRKSSLVSSCSLFSPRLLYIQTHWCR